MADPRRFLPLALVLCYWAAIRLLGGFRADHVGVGLIILGLSYTGSRARSVLRLLLPLIITGIAYDARRYFPDELAGRVRVVEAYLLERRLFGIPVAGGVLIPSEWWQLHTHPALDLVSGCCYITFIASFVLIAAYFQFRVARTGTKLRSADYVRAAAPRVMWSLLWVSLMAFATSSMLPVAPPWYVALHGLGPADVSALPSPAGGTRFDQLVGGQVFSSFYARSVDTFGALPSLHVAYPTLAVYYAFRFGAARLTSVAILLLMCFSAVYLNHHYVLDLVAAWVCALLVAVTLELIHARRRSPLERGGAPSVPG